MLVMEKESGHVEAITTDGVETRMSVDRPQNGRFIRTIDAPLVTRQVSTELIETVAELKQALRANYRQELLMF